MSKDKVMVLAGTFWQIPLIKKIKELGYIVLDINPNENSPAFSFADQYMVADILDRETCLRIARNEHVSAVMSEQCDIANPSVAFISEQMGLNSISSEQAELYTNKLKMREFCQKYGFSNPEFKVCYSLFEAIDFFHSINKKVIIKPLDSNSSRGVFLISSEKDLKKHFEETLSYSKIEKAVLCERYISGTEFTVDGIKTDMGHTSLAVSIKRHYSYNPNIACSLFFSNYNENFDYELLRKTNDDYVNCSGLKFGLTHAEYKYENGKYYLIEIGARGGGNLIGSDIVPLMSGVDNYYYLIEKTLGHKVQETYVRDKNLDKRCAVLQFFDVPGKGGIVKNIYGLDFLENNPFIIRYGLNFKKGDEIHDAKNDSTRIGYFIAYAESQKDLENLIKQINQNFKIEFK